MGKLEGKTAIITGGATGIGEAISKKFSREGAKVLVVGFPDDPVDDVVREIKDKGGDAAGYSGDISVKEHAEEAVREILNRWEKLDILINNAGVFPEINPIEKFSTEAFENLVKNNIRTAFLMTKASVKELQKTEGCIIYAGSESGTLGLPENAAYGGTKGFLHAFMKGIAGEQASRGVRVNCVAPGPIDTAWTHRETSDMDRSMEKLTVNATLMGRRGTPEEVANVYLFLASEEASYVTGAIYPVDGGITIAKGPMGEKVPDGLKEKATKLALQHSKEGATDMK
ncbi:SDR family oxidoreductase [Sinomicrobium pectinilyticum]|uniref:SDR family oxidoreductase n=1 Tax=Sinomicrobium pectinilyticum TaxID=1084421 RepID=A0A3N0EHB3_SINP1|nr:SDR family oxidoreductase [Sinomicrobium pectinilyticum]RNL87276.1 SDR family oxidoreductase [Sinomicrobium pectinilyticum]